jgi:hypothetical protein
MWCPWRESNPHALRRAILSRVRLPVPPHGQRGVIYIVAARPANPLLLSRQNLGPPEAGIRLNEPSTAGRGLAHCGRGFVPRCIVNGPALLPPGRSAHCGGAWWAE